MGFSSQEYWSGLLFLAPGDLPHLGIEPRSPALRADALTSKPPRKPWEGLSTVLFLPYSLYVISRQLMLNFLKLATTSVF